MKSYCQTADFFSNINIGHLINARSLQLTFEKGIRR